MNVSTIAIFSEVQYDHKFGDINIYDFIPYKCEQDYHLILKRDEFLIIDDDTIEYIKSRLTEDMYLIPVIQEGRDDGILEPRLIRCTCTRKVSNRQGVILEDFHIETPSEDQPFGKVRGLIVDQEMDGAMNLIVNTCSMSMYLKWQCTDDIEYLTLAIINAGDNLTVKILIEIANKSMNKHKVVWNILQKIKEIQANNKTQYFFIDKNDKIQAKNEDQLYFVDCQNKINEIEHIIAYYIDAIDEGRSACDKIILNPISSSKHLAIKNMKYYPQKISCDMKRIEFECPKHYNVMNPSIILDDKGYRMILRSVNYLYFNGNWVSQDGTDIINTVNYLLQLDSDFNIVSSDKIEVKADYKRGIINRKIRGHEDARLFKHDGNLWYTATTLDTNPNGLHAISLCKLEGNIVTKLVPLLYKRGRVQKNWLPFSYNSKIHIIYGYAPLTILEVDENTGECKKLEGFRNYQGKYFRGSAGPVKYKSPQGEDGYLIMIHNTNTDYRIYYQRFVWLDDKMIMRYASTAFYFKQSRGLEFPAGMTLSNDGKKVLVSLGVNDSEAWIASIEFDVINEYLFTNGYRI
uniref:Uncharacterized protein n=1 Tax=Pithovirus LCPAC401 TaxID=2506595 RepID=A0A481Z9S8_9VIRU|nr:MAG: uncharacterized protein LCPAC401_00140 [Pithovirus LCPAC401]